VFERGRREGLARTGRWTRASGGVVELPEILWVESEAAPAPPWAGLRLRAARGAAGGPEGFSLGASGFQIEPRGEAAADFLPGFRGGEAAPALVRATTGETAVVYVSREEVPAIPDSIEVGVLGNALPLLNDSARFVQALLGLRQRLGPARILYAPAIAEPARLALLVYLGIDLLDSTASLLWAHRGVLLFPTGRLQLRPGERPPCPCAACSEGRGDLAHRLAHNAEILAAELRLVRAALGRGRLRELVEARVRHESWMVQVLRLLDLEHHGEIEPFWPITGEAFVAGSKESLVRPDIERFRRRLRARYRPPRTARVLLLLPCSARKPYSTSRSHRLFARSVHGLRNSAVVHEVIVTSPLGLVPRELERVYPAQQYDIPVTGHWDRDEAAMVGELLQWLLESYRYDAVVSHLGVEGPLVHPLLHPDYVDTAQGAPLAGASLSRLSTTLQELCNAAPRASHEDRVRAEIESLARYQFGAEVAEALVEGAAVRGRPPLHRVFVGGVQRAIFSPERGLLALTLAGAEQLAKLRRYWVEIDDFWPEGDVFAIGVLGADPEVRIGDDVVVLHGSSIRACGVASMAAPELGVLRKGEAVKVRHRRRPEGASASADSPQPD